MITRVEAHQYRCFQSIDQTLGPFHVLVGPNGSGKSVFLDMVAFLGTLVLEGLEAAVDERSENFHDLVWGREGNCFELAIEANENPQQDTIRYEVQIKIDATSDTVSVASERVIAMSADAGGPVVLIDRNARNATYWSENSSKSFTFELNTGFSAFSSLPLDVTKFPRTVWLKELLRDGVQTVVLDNELLRAPAIAAMLVSQGGMLICPKELSPVPKTVPLPSRARLWLPPQAIATTLAWRNHTEPLGKRITEPSARRPISLFQLLAIATTLLTDGLVVIGP